MKTLYRNNSTGPLLVITAIVLLMTGCRGPWSKNWKVSEMWDVDVTPWSHDDDKAEIPERLVSTWTDTVLHQPGKKPQRGFGGRLIFYGKDNEKPVVVDGQVVIYAFDETNRDPTDNKPTRRYVFPADQIARRISKSELGPSYSFWLPWDEVGGPQIEVSLVARFEPKGGPIVIGEQTRHLLPGEKSNIGIVDSTPSKLPEGIPMRPATPTLAELVAKAKAGPSAVNQVQMASYESEGQTEQSLLSQSPQPTPQSDRRMTTTSISLPENFRIHSGQLQSTAPTGDFVLPGNVAATPQAAPPNYGAVVPPITMPAQATIPAPQANYGGLQPPPQPQAGYPAFVTPSQPQFGNGFVAPLGPPQTKPQAVPPNVGRMGMPPAAPILQGQLPMTTASGWPTVSYPPAAAAGALPTAVAQPSSGYPPQGLQAQAIPASR